MSNKILDLRQNEKFAILLDAGTNGNIVFSDIPILDSNYTIEITDESGSLLNTYTTGSGITIDSTTNAITWAFDENLASGSLGNYAGALKSQSKELGTYFRMFFKIEIHP